MKKYDEGYVLVYVTVVLLIFCLVAAVILTGSMRNLNHQQDAIRQMKDRYVAEGMIEQVLAQLDKKGNITIDCGSFREVAEDGTVLSALTAYKENGQLVLVAQSGDATVSYTLELTAQKIVVTGDQVNITGLEAYSFVSNLPAAAGEGGMAG